MAQSFGGYLGGQRITSSQFLICQSSTPSRNATRFTSIITILNYIYLFPEQQSCMEMDQNPFYHVPYDTFGDEHPLPASLMFTRAPLVAPEPNCVCELPPGLMRRTLLPGPLGPFGPAPLSSLAGSNGIRMVPKKSLGQLSKFSESISFSRCSSPLVY